MQIATIAQLPPELRSPRDARVAVRSVLHGRADRDGADDVLLAVSELATNAIMHAGTAFEVRIGYERGCVRVEVHDGSAELPHPRAAGPDDLGGRGLMIVDRIADRWGVLPDADGKTIWFEREF